MQVGLITQVCTWLQSCSTTQPLLIPKVSNVIQGYKQHQLRIYPHICIIQSHYVLWRVCSLSQVPWEDGSWREGIFTDLKKQGLLGQHLSKKVFLGQETKWSGRSWIRLRHFLLCEHFLPHCCLWSNTICGFGVKTTVHSFEDNGRTKEGGHACRQGWLYCTTLLPMPGRAEPVLILKGRLLSMGKKLKVQAHPVLPWRRTIKSLACL